jgi:predicted N-acyltransferase
MSEMPASSETQEETPRDEFVIRVRDRFCEIDRTAWRGLCGTTPGHGDTPYNPFISHAFLGALEESGCANAETGWLPQYLSLENPRGETVAALPCYLKSHSQGEYVFDHGWADAYERAGGRYYPKLQSSVPFTPATGPRLLISNAIDPKHGASGARRWLEGVDQRNSASPRLTLPSRTTTT